MEALGVLIELRSLRSFVKLIPSFRSYGTYWGFLGILDSFKEFFKNFFGKRMRAFHSFTPRLFYWVILIRTVETNQSCKIYHIYHMIEANI